MIDINELRRLAQAATPGPDGVSLNWLKLLQDFQKEANPAVINELLDRLEEAESDCVEQALLLGMGSSREAALMAKLEAAEKEAAHIKEVEFPRKVRAVAVGWETKCARLEQERAALRAEVESWKGLAAQFGKDADEAKTHLAFAKDELNHLRAKVEEMKGQEPVATVRINAINGNPSVDFVPGHRYLHHNDKLYLASGAKGE